MGKPAFKPAWGYSGTPLVRRLGIRENERVIVMSEPIALSPGLVDIKICALDETWSGLKLMIRRENRRPQTPNE